MGFFKIIKQQISQKPVKQQLPWRARLEKDVESSNITASIGRGRSIIILAGKWWQNCQLKQPKER